MCLRNNLWNLRLGMRRGCCWLVCSLCWIGFILGRGLMWGVIFGVWVLWVVWRDMGFWGRRCCMVIWKIIGLLVLLVFCRVVVVECCWGRRCLDGWGIRGLWCRICWFFWLIMILGLWLLRGLWWGWRGVWLRFRMCVRSCCC